MLIQAGSVESSKGANVNYITRLVFGLTVNNNLFFNVDTSGTSKESVSIIVPGMIACGF